MSRAQNHSLAQLVELAEAGHYSLPVELLDSFSTSQRIRALEVPPTPPLDPETAAARVVADLTAGREPDLLAVGRAVSEATAGGQVFDQTQRILGLAIEQAGDAATQLAADLTERIITEHLRPALEDVHEQARQAAAVLAGHSLDPASLLAAPAKVRNAYLALGPLVSRRSAILTARRGANSTGQRTAQHDVSGLFALFRRPLAFFPHWRLPAQIPSLPIPDDPTEALLWLVSDEAAAAKPWLPTVAEQDAAWWDQFGEAQQMRANAAGFARGFAPH